MGFSSRLLWVFVATVGLGSTTGCGGDSNSANGTCQNLSGSWSVLGSCPPSSCTFGQSGCLLTLQCNDGTSAHGTLSGSSLSFSGNGLECTGVVDWGTGPATASGSCRNALGQCSFQASCASGACESREPAGSGGATSAGGSTGVGGAGNTGGSVGGGLDLRLDGQACTETTIACDAQCEASCGGVPSCIDACCPQHTIPGLYCGGMCHSGTPGCNKSTVQSCRIGWDTCDHTACASQCSNNQTCYDACCSTLLGVYCGGTCTPSCGP